METMIGIAKASASAIVKILSNSLLVMLCVYFYV